MGELPEIDYTSKSLPELADDDALGVCTPVFYENWRCKAQTVINQGGTWSGKTYSILQVLVLRAIHEDSVVITVAGESVPVLKAGAYLDIEQIYNKSPYFRDQLADWNQTDRVLRFKSGSQIQFKSYDTFISTKGSKRDYLFVNEADFMTWDYFWELQRRTRKQVFIDYNPTAPFWAHDRLIGSKNVKMIRSWHIHNPFLTQEQRDDLELLKTTDYERWRVYARGLTGNVTGLIYPKWTKIPDESFPWHEEDYYGGIDYGYTNDPTALVKIVKHKGDLYFHELYYKAGTDWDTIEKVLREHGFDYNHTLYSEHDKDAIATLRRRDFVNIQMANKARVPGITMVNSHRCFYTQSSENIHQERMRYVWEKARDTGRYMNVPKDGNDHLMDAIRYAVYTRYFQEVDR